MGLFNSKRNKRFFGEEDYFNDFREECEKALSVFEQLCENGFKENALAVFDFDFVSDKKEKLTALKDFFEPNYAYSFQEIAKKDSLYTLTGETLKLPFDEDGLLFWAIDLYTKGFEFDCILNGYGSLPDSQNLEFLDLAAASSSDYFESGLELLNKKNYSNAIIDFGTAIRIDPANKEAYQARGYCKDELKVPKLAREDYDKALEIDPNYVDALLIRATNKDDAGEHQDALQDYDKVIKIDPENNLAYYNRGNTRFSLGDKSGACNDWIKAKELGSEYAQERLDKECKK